MAKLELLRRGFPDFDRTLHCLAVKTNDEMLALLKQEKLASSDIKRLADLLDIIVLIKKQAPQLTPKPKEESVNIQDII